MYGSIDIMIEAFGIPSPATKNHILFVSTALGRTFEGHPVSGICLSLFLSD